jgi:hypothetical protein
VNLFCAAALYAITLLPLLTLQRATSDGQSTTSQRV